MSKENNSSVDDFRMSTGYPFQVQRMSKGDEDILWLSIGCPQVVLWRGRPKVVIKTFTLYKKRMSFKDVMRTREGLKSGYPQDVLWMTHVCWVIHVSSENRQVKVCS